MFNHGLRFRLLWRYLITVLSPKVRLPIKVLSNDETVDFILRNQSSASRFGEGEVQLMRGGNLDFQVFDPQLADRMKEILTVLGTASPKIPEVLSGNLHFRLVWKCIHQQAIYGLEEKGNWGVL